MPEPQATNVVPFSKEPQIKERGLLGRVEAYQRLAREWSAHLDAYEQIVLLQIIDRSAGWGREVCVVTTRALREGSGANRGIADAISRRKLFDTLRSLEEKGIVRRHDRDGRLAICVNLGWEPPMIAIPKRIREAAEPVHEAHSPVHEMHQPVQEVHPYTDTPTDTSTSISDHAPLVGPAGVRQLAVRAAEANLSRRSGKTAKAMTKTGAKSVEAVWRSALVETFPGAVHKPWSPAQLGMAKNAANGWTHNREILFPQFVDWAVRNWTQIMAKQFRWMKESKPPATPAWQFFVHFLGQFAECYVEHKLDDWLNEAERTDLERRIARGQTYDEAVAEIGAERAATRMRKENEAARQDAASKLRRARAAEERAERIAAQGGAPVHPKAPAHHMRRSAAPSDVDIEVNVPLVPKENPFD